MTNDTICILGGTGFVGRHLASRLHQHGWRIRVLTRNIQRRRELAVLPRVDTITVPDLSDATLAERLEGCSTVVNLVGILNGSPERFEAVHAELPRRVARIAAERGVGRFLHMSALNADADQGPSLYLKSKGRGEQAAFEVGRTTGLKVTAFRPSIIFGPDDSFFNRFAALLRISPVFPLACPRSRFAPVHVLDVVQAFMRALDDDSTAGQAYELCGPNTYTFRELIDMTLRWNGMRRLVVPLPDALARLQARIFEWVPGQPFTMDNYRSLQRDNVCSGDNGLLRLGITPRSVESVMRPHFEDLAGSGGYQRFRGQARRG